MKAIQRILKIILPLFLFFGIFSLCKMVILFVRF